MKTTKFLTDNDILDMAFEKLDVANPNVNKVMEIAELMDLEYDDEEGEYKNPDYIDIYIGVPDCFKCDPLKAENTISPISNDKHQCRCGNIF